jgi:hypothetical protein
MWKPGQCGNPNRLGNCGRKEKEIAWQVNENGCFICTSHAKDMWGYPKKRHLGKMTFISHIVFEKKHGAIPLGLHVLHKCDNPACINHSHLFLGTIAENNRDCNRKGRRNLPFGERHWKTHLTNFDINNIRLSSLSQIELSKQYGISRRMINYIINNKFWKQVA